MPANDIVTGSEQKMGFHLGLYAKMNIPIFYFETRALAYPHQKRL